MIRNYMTIALRNIKKHHIFSFINMVGLSVGMACVVLILIWIHYETGFEIFHNKANRIFRVAIENKASSPPARMVVTPPPMAPALAQEFPEIETSVRLSRGGGDKLFTCSNNHFYESFYAVDPGFFTVFSMDFILGDASKALLAPNSIVLSEKMAIKFFRNQDPLGKIIQFDGNTDLKVTGVIKNIPTNSHIQRDIFIPFETWGEIYQEPMDEWRYMCFYTYLLLKANADANKIEENFSSLAEKYGIPNTKIFLQPLKSIHLYSHYSGELGSNTHISTLVLLGSIALLILIIACINYMNLTTARSSSRTKEIGTRKVIGAHRLQIAQQFLGESMLMSLISLGISLVLVYLFMPIFNSLAERSLTLNWDILLQILPGILILVMFVGLFGGSYPAFLLSSLKPISIIKGSSKQKTRLRNVLVIFQFAISLILIIAALLVKSQLDYVKNKKMGFNKDQIVIVSLHDPGIRNNAGSVIEELKKNPRIQYAAASMHLPNEVGATTTATWPGKPADLRISIKASEAGYDFPDLYEINIDKGRKFSREFPSDESGAFLINQTAEKVLGDNFKLGMEFVHWRGKGKIVGVMQDYHHNSLHEEIKPLYVFLNPDRGNHLSIKIQGGDIPGTVGYIQDTIKKFSPHYPFEYHFFDDLFNMTYLSEQKIEKVFTVFSIIAVFIACMGVFGLSTFLADQKRKEIGIRKVLGASASKIVYLLSRDLVWLVLIANLIGWPVVYYAMNRWLQNFAYRTNINPAIFLLSAALILLVSLGTLSFQAIKAAVSNPVDSLRYE